MSSLQLLRSPPHPAVMVKLAEEKVTVCTPVLHVPAPQLKTLEIVLESEDPVWMLTSRWPPDSSWFPEQVLLVQLVSSGQLSNQTVSVTELSLLKLTETSPGKQVGTYFTVVANAR